MDLSLVYLLNRTIYRITEFLRHWYLDAFLKMGHYFFTTLEKLDHFFALKITLKHLFQPLYQDYTLIGYVWGFIFRSLRILVGGLIYFGLALLAIAVYLAWAILPVYVIYKIYGGKL